MYRLKISHDTFPVNPRENYHYGTMVCWHSKYDLGDEQPSEPPTEYLADLAALHNPIIRALFEISDQYLNIVEGAREDVRAAIHNYRYGYHNRLQVKESWDIYREAQRLQREGTSVDKRVMEILEDYYVILPLYLYDHSGLTISTSGFSCPWDSGQVGHIYMSLDQAAEHGLTSRKEIAEALVQEVKTYDDYLTGSVYRFEFEELEIITVTRRNGPGVEGILSETVELNPIHEESVCGFYGDPMESGIRESLSPEGQKLLDQWDYSKVGEWIYSDSVPEELREE